MITPVQRSHRSSSGALSGTVRVVVGLGVPAAAYYLLRAAGAGVYLALVVGAVLSAVPGLVTLARERRVSGLSTYMTAMMLGGLAVSLLPGSTSFLLAKESVMTAVTGVWFIASIRAHRPLAYLFSRPVLQGRFRWPSDWDRLWRASPRFRRMWGVSSVLWGVGLLADAVARVVMAFTLPPDLVPGLSLVLYLGTTAVLIVVTTAYYVSCGVYDRRSALYPAPARS